MSTAAMNAVDRTTERNILEMVDGEAVTDKGLVIAAGSTVVVQAGKRKFARVTVR